MPEFSLNHISDADRRSVLKILGVGGAAAAGTGFGILSLTGSAAAATVDISSSNPDTAVSDDGAVDEVYVEPTLTTTWDGFDDVVGKVRVLIEAATGEIDLDPPEIQELDYTPVFRATGYANGTDNDVEQESGPGTNGEFTLDWFSGDDRITVYGNGGKPDYVNAAYNCGATVETYLDGTLMGDPIDGAQNGFYGAAGDTDPFEEETDAGSNTTTVYLRYTVSLHQPDVSFVEEDGYDLDPEDVRPFSPLAMAGGEEGQYPDLTDPDRGTTVTSEEAGDYEDVSEGYVVPATAIPYAVMRDSTDHPAIMSTYTHFDVEIENEPAEAGVEGDSGAGVSVDEDVDTMTPGGNESATDTDAPNGSETPNGTDTPSGTEPPNGTETPSHTDTPSGTDTSNGTDTPSGTNTSNGTDAPSGNETTGGNGTE